MICAKLACMSSLALSVAVFNAKLVVSIIREHHDIGFAHMLRTEPMSTKIKEGKRQCHFKYDG